MTGNPCSKRLPAVFLLFFFSPLLLALENFELNLKSGTAMGITHYPADTETLLMWVPSERGFGKGYVPVALNLASMGYDVWAIDLHSSYMEPKTRSSMDKFDPQDLVELAEIAQQRHYKNIYFLSSGRGAQLVLKTLRLFQQKQPESSLLKGSVFLYPQIIKGRPDPGSQPDFVAISALSNLPIYLFFPEYSTKFAHRSEISEQLQKGGSAVFVHNLKNVQGGFHMRPEEDLTESDLAMKTRLPELYEQAFRLLRSQPHQAPIFSDLDDANNESYQPAFLEPVLQPYRGNQLPPALVLAEIGGQNVNLADYKGQVVLVNFWATWCGPCVEEIPSLSRMEQQLSDKPFTILTVNIGEPRQTILDFMKEITFTFPILMDNDGQAVRDWKVYAYPSNFLIDKSGKIQYAYRGALEWDSPEVLKTIESLL